MSKLLISSYLNEVIGKGLENKPLLFRYSEFFLASLASLSIKVILFDLVI